MFCGLSTTLNMLLALTETLAARALEKSVLGIVGFVQVGSICTSDSCANRISTVRVKEAICVR